MALAVISTTSGVYKSDSGQGRGYHGGDVCRATFEAAREEEKLGLSYEGRWNLFGAMSGPPVC
jgi:hypothetical protein